MGKKYSLNYEDELRATNSGWVEKYWGETRRAEEEIIEALHKNDILKTSQVTTREVNMRHK